jgi:pimeloyl-ACP methyl ester carboxylesterase
MSSIDPSRSTTEFVPVDQGRRIAVESYGDPQGAPVFFFHGWPSSRWQGALGDRTAREIGVRLLAIDRPGMGGSDLHAGRRLLDWPPILSRLADFFGCEKFHVLGVSGGGPYALASAWALSERVKGAAFVSGAPSIAERVDVSTLMPVYRLLLWLYRRHPEAVRVLFRAGCPLVTIRPPRWLWRCILRTIPECDRQALDQPEVLDRAWAGYSGAWVGHPDGVFHDARIYAEPWGFDPAEIRVPVRLWHGREDRNFHWPLAEEIAAKIPGCRATIIEHEGHYSLIVRHHREILRDLISC